MDVTPDKHWEAALALIAQNVSPQQFDTWFKPIVFESFNDETKLLVLRVPSSFVYEYIEEHYIDLLSRVLFSAFGQRIRLTYRVVVDSEHKKTQDIEADPAEAHATQAAKTWGAKQKAVEEPAKEQELDPQLNPHQTFSNYIEGESNKLSRSVGLSIAEHPNTNQFNPMFIYGPSGCGKTHLVNAIGVQTKQLYPQKRVLYISAHLFQLQFVNAVLKNATGDFIKFYQTIDMLIVDDVQTWASAEKTQETFVHIFNHLFRNGKRIILASDRPPVELNDMSDRLITRFSCGIIAELEKPNVQLCVDILNAKIRRDGLKIPAEVTQFIAETANGSVRDLEGVINSLMAYSVVYNSDIDMRLAERVIKRAVKVDDTPLTVDDILEKVSNHFNVSVSAVSSKSRKRDLVVPRQVSMYLAQKYTKMPASRIGKLVGGRDHSTVLHSCAQVEARLKTDSLFAAEVESIATSFKLKG